MIYIYNEKKKIVEYDEEGSFLVSSLSISNTILKKSKELNLNKIFTGNEFNNNIKFNLGTIQIGKEGLYIGNIFNFGENSIKIRGFKIKKDGLYLENKKIKELSELQNKNFKITNKEINYKNKIIINKDGIKFYDKKIDKNGVFFSKDTYLNKEGLIFKNQKIDL